MLRNRQPARFDELTRVQCGVGELTNLRISEEERCQLVLHSLFNNNVPGNAEQQTSRGTAAAAAAEVVVTGANTSPYFKRTISFRMVLSLFYFPPFCFLHFIVLASVLCMCCNVGLVWFSTTLRRLLSIKLATSSLCYDFADN